MTCGPWATVLGPRLIGLKFKNYLTLEAWRLQLAACSFYEPVRVLGMKVLRLGAWRLSLTVTVVPGPLLMDLVYDSSVSHM